MKARDKDKIKISFIGGNAEGVTGSMTLVEINDRKILLECGLVQGRSSLNDFKENSKPFKFKAKTVDYLFLLDNHIDHIGNVGKLVHAGFSGKILVNGIKPTLMKPMLKNGHSIMMKDAMSFDRNPYYTEDDIDRAFDLMEVYKHGNTYWLDETVGFELLDNSHIVGASQLMLYLKKSNGYVEKILYTGDVGSFKNVNHYVDKTKRCESASLVICESTYGGKLESGKAKREKDLEKMKTVINNTIENGGSILIPVFAQARAQQILTDLYMLYKDDKEFKTKIVCDSPLMFEMFRAYGEVLTGNNKELYTDVIAWKNVSFIKDYSETKLSLGNQEPRIILSSSGFLEKGRSVEYLKHMINNPKNHILFVGYAPEHSIGGKIKNNQRYITIEGKSYKNNIGITCLNSYSSHASHYELLDYLGSINCQKICLVHGEMESKVNFKRYVEQRLFELNKTAKVIATNKSTVITL